MKTLIFTLIFFVLASHCYGQADHDKAIHFVGGALSGLVGASIAKKATHGNRAWTFTGAVVASTLAGVTKEAIDASQQGNRWDNADLLATVLGGITVGITIDLLSKKDTDNRLKGNYSHIDIKQSNQKYFGLNTNCAMVDGKLPSMNYIGLSSDLNLEVSIK